MDAVSTRMVQLCNLYATVIGDAEQTPNGDGVAHPLPGWAKVVEAADLYQLERRQWIKTAEGKRIILSTAQAAACSRKSRQNNALPEFGWNGSYITAIREDAVEGGAAVKLRMRAGLDRSLAGDIETAEARLGKQATRRIQKRVATADMNSPLNPVLPEARETLSLSNRRTLIGRIDGDWDAIREGLSREFDPPAASPS